VHVGKTLFAQLMDFLPGMTFTRIIARDGGDRRVRMLSCAEPYRAMAFAQLTYRESLRDIETCRSVQSSKLYHMGFRQPVRRSTLADASERRDWRIYAELAQRLIAQARKLYAGEDLGVELSNTVYALDSTTIDLCLSVFPWAHFRATKAAVKLHTLLDLRGSIPSFIHISDGKLHDVHALDLLMPEPGAINVIDRGDVDFERLHVLNQAGAFFVTRAKSNMDAHPAVTVCPLYKSRWQVELFFKWIKQHLRIKRFYGPSENAVKTQRWIAISVYVLVAIVKKRLSLDASLYTLLQVLSVALFEKLPINQTCHRRSQTRYFANK
jgi:hypothetical protein